MSAWLFAAIIAIISVALVLGGRWFALNKAFKGRENLDVDLILSSYGANEQLDSKIYNKVVGKLAESIDIDLGLIRPNDTLDELFGLDTWQLGEGQDQFEEWLLDYVGSLPEFSMAKTVADLVFIVQERTRINGVRF